ncbi:MAG: hypothetical protein ACKVXR_15590 [Planctomycetota bacterium]
MDRGLKPPPSAGIPLMRGGNLVSTITGAFGQSLRETRLTALLGYLIALEVPAFQDLFGFEDIPQGVTLEMRHDVGRSDIVVETNRGRCVIEAKLDASDPLVQARKYAGCRTVLLTDHMPSAPAEKHTRYVSWERLGELLDRLSHARNAKVRVLSADLLSYLKEHRMVRNRESVEIYAREINEPTTLAVLLQGHLYGCRYERGSSISQALYFAPHFGQRIADEHPGIVVGLSYVARIDSVGQATSWEDLQALLKERRGRRWLTRHRAILDSLHRKWSWPENRTFLLLGEPRLVFNPPVRKERLQKGKGWLSKRFFSFDQLFAAWKA